MIRKVKTCRDCPFYTPPMCWASERGRVVPLYALDRERRPKWCPLPVTVSAEKAK